MTDPAGLLAVLDAAAAELPDVAVDAVDEDRTWSRHGLTFAVLAGSAVDLRIGATIAEAAVRTPDTTPSNRGADWVTFVPAVLDDHACDRLAAWFAAAGRRAEPG